MGVFEGGCQCGKVRYRLENERTVVAACHCTECQRQTGSAFGMSLIVPRESFSLSGETKTFTRPADSGATVACAFCPECGTRIFHQPSSLPDTVNVKPGTLDDPSWVEPALHLFVASKQPWTPIPEGVPRFDGAPPKPKT